ncbi:molecular chaperone DnaK [Fervidibacter sacchari]|uniref:Chaperone protein DnaK n=1 Tax=Candidatus Fervidibacter sacchari TaxID=1448929 RepID=A0ABT2ENK8_9BACT|nr:molecular chaperone DnaK [Candidatus Fervidibacter sacchari]MCS3919269.1 molecular chaperone DnaK [Candidatus Fervidibacter sacchari]WKU15009.1 molecular chaperone DnaK [Candidatus Fervidibacter sacchari]
MPRAVGIDLGTTNSVIAVMEADGNVKVIPNAEGSNLTPSVVAFTKDGQRLVGIPAKRQALLNPENTVYSIKRFIGRTYTATEVERRRVPYKVVPGPNDIPMVEIPVLGNKRFTPEEISAFILQKLKQDAEAYLGEEIKQAVITVPAYFDSAQRTATKNAGEIAGLEVLRIIPEPTAAALAYGFDKKKEGLILVWDLGGGTFDVSILEIGEGVFEVKATAGDSHLGGDDWDERLMNYLADIFANEHGIDLRKDRQALQRLKEAAEKAKIELSSMLETEVNLPFISFHPDKGPLHLNVRITRAKFEELTRDLLERCERPFKQAIQDAGIKLSQIEEVILVGGATRMPMVQELVRKLTGKEPHKGVNPDEVVAVGAAIQAAVLTGKTKDIVLLDVVPLSLGVETLGGVMTVLIPRNTTIPTRKSEIFTTAADGQTTVEIHVLQGERPLAKDNRSLGKFYLTGIPPAPRGVPQIEVTFDIDTNGILHVTAKDLATGREQSIVIKDSTNLPREEIDRMIREAEMFAEQDRKMRELAETRNEADALIYSAEKTLREHGDRISASDKSAVESAINDLREKMKGDDIAAIRAGIERLKEAMFKISEQLYRATAQAAGGGEARREATTGGEVIDADYKPAD